MDNPTPKDMSEAIEHVPGKEGSRNHVVWWSNKGQHCSEPNCEINKERIEELRNEQQ